MTETAQAWEEVTATIPASAQFLRAARLITTATASAGAFDVDALEDIRVVVHELLSAALDIADGPIEFIIRVRTGQFEYRGSVPCSKAGPQLDPMRSVIVSSLADTHFYKFDGTTLRIGFAKSAENRS